jgi:hypothetical protein
MSHGSDFIQTLTWMDEIIDASMKMHRHRFPNLSQLVWHARRSWVSHILCQCR